MPASNAILFIEYFIKKYSFINHGCPERVDDVVEILSL